MDSLSIRAFVRSASSLLSLADRLPMNIPTLQSTLWYWIPKSRLKSNPHSLHPIVSSPCVRFRPVTDWLSSDRISFRLPLVLRLPVWYPLALVRLLSVSRIRPGVSLSGWPLSHVAFLGVCDACLVARVPPVCYVY